MKSSWLRPAILVLVLLALTGAVAALGGWWWWSWWGPAIEGQIYQMTADPHATFSWLANPPDPGQAHVAAATFQYVVVGFVLALGLGVVAGLLGRNRPYVTLATCVVAGALGAWVMWAVGQSFSPPDPSRWADAAHLGKTFPGRITVAGWPAYLVWPVGVLFGFLGVMLGITSEKRVPATSGTPAPETAAVSGASADPS